MIDIEMIFRPVKRRLRELEDRITALEQRTFADVYQGVYRADGEYYRGDAVSHGGSLWIATDEPTGKPPGNGWVLAVKRGRDAR